MLEQTEVGDSAQAAAAVGLPTAHGAAGPLTGELPARGSTVVIRGGRGRASLDSLKEIWAYREVFLAFTVRAVKVKYKQTTLGIGWAIVQPLVATAIFAVVFGRYAHLGSENAPYVVFALAGMVAWLYFSAATSMSVNSLVEDSQLLRKVYFPRELLPLAGTVASLVDLIPALIVFGFVSNAYGVHPAVTWLAIPGCIVLIVTTVAAIGLILSAFNVYYRDVRHMLPFIMQIGLYASPVVYSLDIIPAPWRTIWAIVNPMAAAIDGIRASLVRHQWPDPLMMGGAMLWTLVLLVIGYTLFKRLERGFADRV